MTLTLRLFKTKFDFFIFVPFFVIVFFWFDHLVIKNGFHLSSNQAQRIYLGRADLFRHRDSWYRIQFTANNFIDSEIICFEHFFQLD